MRLRYFAGVGDLCVALTSAPAVEHSASISPNTGDGDDFGTSTWRRHPCARVALQNPALDAERCIERRNPLGFTIDFGTGPGKQLWTNGERHRHLTGPITTSCLRAASIGRPVIAPFSRI